MGGEFITFKNYLRQKGIIHGFSCPHTYHQNGKVETRHRQIVEIRLTLLVEADICL